ncbi:hypothetical protein HY990_00465 [Candidatus Micrarchaeota archaeon]|nr:hypothetical protein [Candidatus Micrarchaeota archaeon]
MASNTRFAPSAVAAKLEHLGFRFIHFEDKPTFQKDFGNACVLVELLDRPESSLPSRVGGGFRVPFGVAGDFSLDYSPPASSRTVDDPHTISRILYQHDLGPSASEALVRSLGTKDHLVLEDGSTYCAFLNSGLELEQTIAGAPVLSSRLDQFARNHDGVCAILEDLDAYAQIDPVARGLLKVNNPHGELLSAYCDRIAQRVLSNVYSYLEDLLGLIADRAVIDL